jgi:REP element-mobilizing transposase RayT
VLHLGVTEKVRISKAETGRILRKEFRQIQEFLGADDVWGEHYFAETITDMDKEVVEKECRQH